MRTSHTVGWEARTVTGKDSHGNPVFGLAPVVDLPVHGWTDADEALGHARDGSRLSKVVYVPASCPVRVDDVLVIDGGEHLVEAVKDYTRGPWSFTSAGFELWLKLVKG